MAKNLVIQGSNAAMMSVTSRTALSVAAGLREDKAGDTFRRHYPVFLAGVISLVVVGVLVVLLSIWLSSHPEAPPMEPRSDLPFGNWVLQPLVSGNLAICSLWVWLDRLAIRLSNQNSGTREILLSVMLVVVFVSTILCCYIVRIQGDGEVIAVATFISLPILAVTVPLLWLALARMATLRLRALVLAGFVFASSFAQERVTVSMARGDEMSLFAVNSCLIGLAVVIWLLSWIPKPSVARTT